MKILDKTGEKVNTVEEWLIKCPPAKGANQWKDGRSAKEFAKYILDCNKSKLPNEIKYLLQKLGITYDEDWVGYPERKTCFDSYGGNTRNHDMLLINSKSKIIIGIEAKADESLGDKVDKEREKAKSNAKSNKLIRLDEILDIIYPNNEKPQENDIRYQLLTATIGTIHEAKQQLFDCAILLIINFVPSDFNVKRDEIKWAEKKKVEVNKCDVKKYIRTLCENCNIIEIENGFYAEVKLKNELYYNGKFFIADIDVEISVV